MIWLPSRVPPPKKATAVEEHTGREQVCTCSTVCKVLIDDAGVLPALGKQQPLPTRPRRTRLGVRPQAGVCVAEVALQRQLLLQQAAKVRGDSPGSGKRGNGGKLSRERRVGIGRG